MKNDHEDVNSHGVRLSTLMTALSSTKSGLVIICYENLDRPEPVHIDNLLFMVSRVGDDALFAVITGWKLVPFDSIISVKPLHDLEKGVFE